MVRLQTAITFTMPMASSFFVNGGLRSLAIGILCSGAAVQGSPPDSAGGAELHSIEALCGASHVNSSITYSDDAQACSQLRSTITPFNTDFLCPAQIFLRHAQDHTEPPTGSVSIPE